ncbi:hypothetical protein Dimus_014397 [Dionaea muscipula]
MAGSSSSGASFLGDQNQLNHQQHSSSAAAAVSPSSSVPQKKRRNLPGTPNPDAEIIAISPKTLMATNRFICEVCNKGFQREQNLQLHRRGHNLPWKLKQKGNKVDGQPVRKKVYLCPEPTCVHHDPARALGDLTGIKKHYSRKHGEKKFKCEKCSKRYAVQSDWKAHSKTCGTREYRCDCGTLFSRRDSFITHRAFCDALAHESARHIPASLTHVSSHLFSGGSCSGAIISLGLSQGGTTQTQLQLPGGSHQLSTDIHHLGSGSRFEQLLSSTTDPNPTLGSAFHPPPPQHFSYYGIPPESSQPYKQNPMQQLPNLQVNSTADVGHNAPSSFHSNSCNLASSGSLYSGQFNIMHNCSGSSDGSRSSLFPELVVPSLYNAPPSTIHHMSSGSSHMSATALLHKAAQMGSTASSLNPSTSSLLSGFGLSSLDVGGVGGDAALTKSDKKQQLLVPAPTSANFVSIFGDQVTENHHQSEGNSQLQHLMSSLAGGSSSSMFGFACGGSSDIGRHTSNNPGADNKGSQLIPASDRLTRDFLGVGEIVIRSTRDQQKQQQQLCGRVDVVSNGSLDSAAVPTTRPFTSGNFQ